MLAALLLSVGAFELPKLPSLFGGVGAVQGGRATPRCDALLDSLFRARSLSPSEVAAACSPSVLWEDLSSSSAWRGPQAVQAGLEAKFPAGSALVLDRLADGARASGFTWHREAEGEEGEGLRGTLYAELDEQGRLSYVREGCEPLFKPGEATEALLKAITKGVEREEAAASYTRRTPKTAGAIVEYLWREAYPGGAKPDEALRLFAEDITYEDFNYRTPFVGKAAVTEFLDAFDIPGIEFKLLRASDGERACAFTWKVYINGNEGPEGISFYEVDASGKVCYIRDIPAPSIKPPPLLTLATMLNPKLRVFKARNVLM